MKKELIGVFFIFTITLLSFASATDHPDYPGFAEPEFTTNNGILRITDKLIFGPAYYSVNGQAWQELPLEGEPLLLRKGQLKTPFLLDEAEANLPNELNEEGTHYLIVFSCGITPDGLAWDCHGEGGVPKWQLEVIENSGNSEDKCIKIFGEGNPEETLNIFIVSVNYPNEALLYEKPYDLDDFTVNFENDVNRLLFSEDEFIEYGLLMVEPFASNLDKVSVFIYPEKEYFEPTQESSSDVIYYSREMLAQECPYYEEKSFVHLIIGEKQEQKYRGWIGMFGSGLYSGSFRENVNGYGHTVGTFRHELGHQFGAGDLYGPAYRKENIETYNNYYADDYDSFWEFYNDLILGKEMRNSNDGERSSTLSPNCDLNAGCPKWCEGEPNPIGDLNPCADYDEINCEELVPGTPDCTWYPSIHPYFESQCVPEPMSFQVNIGTQCKEGASCYLGCQGRGFRSHPEQQLAAQWIDSEGKLQGYDVPTRDFINDALHCCYTTNCQDNYDYSNCIEFSETYEPHNINVYGRYTGCSGCN